MSASRVRTSFAIIFDFIEIFLIGVWILGGISFHGHVYLSHGADPRRAAILLGILAYFLGPEVRERSFVLKSALRFGKVLTYPRLRIGFFTLAFFFTLFLAALQTLALRVTLYDVGIFHQILWSLTHRQAFRSTISGAGNFLLDHFSPSLVLLAPFFDMAHSSPLFLPLVHVGLLFLGGAAWISLAARVPGCSKAFQAKLAAATTVFFLSFESIWTNVRWGFHENAIAFASISWAMALLLGERNPKYGKKSFIYLLLLVAAGSKEILLLNVSLIFTCWAYLEWKGKNGDGVQKKSDNGDGVENSRVGSTWRSTRAFPIFLFLNALLFLGVFVAFELVPHPADKNYFVRYYGYLGESLGEFLRNLLRSPKLIVKTIGLGELAKYLLRVFLPWLCLPIPFFATWLHRRVSKQPPKRSVAYMYYGIAILPSMLSAALATFPPLRSSSYHYVLELWPILACITIRVLAGIQSVTLIWIWAILSLVRMDYDPFAAMREYWKGSQKVQEVRQRIQSYPESLALVSDDLAGTWVAGRMLVTRWPDLSLLPNQCPDKIVVRNSSNGTLTALGVQQVLNRCAQIPKAKAQVPVWRVGDWAEYQLK